MPRVAASIISLLGMLTFMTKNKMPDSWTDVFLEAMCLQVALHLFAEFDHGD